MLRHFRRLESGDGMDERTALVVGGTSGIGLAAARRFRAGGATVHVVGRDADRLAAVARTDPDLRGHRADGGDRAGITAVVDAVGRIDWLVVAVSSGGGMGPIGQLDLTVLRTAFEGKFWAQLTTVQAVLPRLAPDGSITLVGAISAHSAMPGTAGLSAINSAVEGLVRPLAVELAPVRVNAVSPGMVDTPWWDRVPAERREERFAAAARSLPVRRVATADDVAEAVVLVATNPNITGTVLSTDGGARLVTLD
jgi:NAD(P)-dependent dehydrogenase (short-subunit alcohol dehydrogenase family)